MIIPKRGMRFIHPHLRVMQPGVPVRDWPHEVREITAVTGYVVYHRRAGSTGRASFVTCAWFSEHITETVGG